MDLQVFRLDMSVEVEYVFWPNFLNFQVHGGFKKKKKRSPEEVMELQHKLEV